MESKDKSIKNNEGVIHRKLFFLGHKFQTDRGRGRDFFKRLYCPPCDRIFRTEGGLHSHLWQIHKLKQTPAYPISYKKKSVLQKRKELTSSEDEVSEASDASEVCLG